MWKIAIEILKIEKMQKGERWSGLNFSTYISTSTMICQQNALAIVKTMGMRSATVKKNHFMDKSWAHIFHSGYGQCHKKTPLLTCFGWNCFAYIKTNTHPRATKIKGASDLCVMICGT